MKLEQLKGLICLAQKQDWAAAALACGMAPDALVRALAALEAEYGQPLLCPGPAFRGFTPAGERVLDWARSFSLASHELRQDLAESRGRARLAPLLQRRSVSPKRLAGPGPAEPELALILQAGLHAPDHGGLQPWRVIEFGAGQREALADCFEAEKRRRDPLAAPADLRRAREHATRAPVLLGFVVSPQPRARVPVREQWLAAGAALGNVLNAAHQLGFGAIVLSGERCYDPLLCAELGLQPQESLAGFISLGRVAQAPPPRPPGAAAPRRSLWPLAASASAGPGAQAGGPAAARR